MKRILLFAIIAMASVGAISAQKGKSALGLNVGFAPSISGYTANNMGVGIKYQYFITDVIRAEADIDYWFMAKEEDNFHSSAEQALFDVSVNFHYLFHASKNFNVYPLVGAGYALDMYKHEIEETEETCKHKHPEFLINAGIGAEYSFSERFSLGLEVKYQYVTTTSQWSRLPISLGIAYKF